MPRPDLFFLFPRYLFSNRHTTKAQRVRKDSEEKDIETRKDGGGIRKYQTIPSSQGFFTSVTLAVMVWFFFLFSTDHPFLPPKKKNENDWCRWLSGFHSFFWWQGDVGCLWEIASAFGCPYLIRSNFIKTTYDISLDSWISFLPLGFSPTLKEKTENPKVRKEMESRPGGEHMKDLEFWSPLAQPFSYRHTKGSKGKKIKGLQFPNSCAWPPGKRFGT